ncbi:MAG: 6-bladed beta-propeller [Deltaproteobacteria bacterium]|jgi:DNA-binding beta-propeller fold protein YncE|nr:6-bladed beta-propeller [Deltaproteobacteria bacterium]
MPENNRTFFICTLLCCLMALTGCAASQQAMAGAAGEAPTWPSDGETVRIRYVSSFSLPEDLQIRQGMLSRIWDYVVGAPFRGLAAPHGIAVDADGTIYVVDAALKTVQIYNGSKNKFSMVPDDDHLFKAPINPAVDIDAARLYVTDSADGLVRFFPLASGGAPGEFGKGQLERPTGIALNNQTNELLVLDTRQEAVFRYNRQDLTLMGRFGSRGTGDGQLNRPTDLTVNSSGEILVSDSLNFRVQVFSPTGEFRRVFGAAGDTPGYFSRPKGIAVDSDSNIYVVDTLFDNVQIFDTEGKLLLSFGRAGQGPGEFWMPAGICIDRNDRIYVADTYNKRIQTFQYLKQAGHK